jgi:hypothetical protein
MIIPLSSAYNFINYYEKQKDDIIELKVNSPDNIYEWQDGTFSGIWHADNKDEQGQINGILKQGRTPDIGTFIGQWQLLDEKGFAKGFFINTIIIGKIINEESKILSYFFGKIDYNNNHFSTNINSFKFGKIFVSGEFIASFMPSLTGSFNIGVQKFHLVDKNRLEEFTKNDSNDFRELMVQLWYPIDKETTGEKIEYMDLITFEWLMGRSPIPLITIPKTAYKFVQPHGIINAEIASYQNQFPVIIFSPGYDGNYEIYTSLIEDLVSNGFIVASINHPYISGITVFPDGRAIRASPVQNISLPTIISDAKFVLDFITELNNTNQFFLGRLDLSKVGMYGHSFGGASTIACLYDDSRFICGLTLDGVIYEELINKNFNKPIMIILAENSFSTNSSDYLWDYLIKDAYQLTINGSTHYAFTDVGILLRHLLPFIPPKLLSFGSIDPKRMINITKSYELAFFQTYLKNGNKEHIMNLSDVFPEVIIKSKNL